MKAVAVIGAGLAGLTCAQALQTGGWRVTVLEKSRGAGGRLSTRRTDSAHYDHGAQYFTARDPRFAGFIEQRLADESVARWQPRLAQPVDDVWYVGTPGMSALGRAQAQGLDLRTEHRVTSLVRGASHWDLALEDGRILGGFDAVVVAVPNEQAVPLLEQHAAAWAAELAQTPMQPCWTVMFSTDQALSDFDAGLPVNSPLGWWARNSSKPARPVMQDRHDWVLQAQAHWSTDHVDLDKAEVAQALLAAFGTELGVGTIKTFAPAMAHRWLYARRMPELQPLTEPRWQSELGLGVCGDGLSHSRVEQAYLSGQQLADTILNNVSSS